ncbi:keratin-associated protein 16-1 [Culex quinquefasciatus]|nr:keratin-associated protein 16-1 [Culex quinquefasciatus]
MKASLLVVVSSLIAVASGFTLESFPCGICKPTEILSETIPCCEPSCDNDCSQVICPEYSIYKPSCVCRAGFVRYEGECIPITACPAVEPIPSCPPYEELQPTPACCEPTCSDDCSNFVCRLALIHKPTCVCERGYVRYDGRCIKPDQCPTCGPYARYSNCTPCCESTCELDCSLVLCLAPCTGPPTCLCQPGFVKHNGVCIKQELCPRGGIGNPVAPPDGAVDYGAPDCSECEECVEGYGDVPYQLS